MDICRTDKEMMEAVLKSKTDLTAKQKKDVVDTFRNFDRNGNGSILSSELKVAMRALGFEPRKNDIKKMLEKVDKGNTGKQSSWTIQIGGFILKGY